jgi:hypothetical protein
MRHLVLALGASAALAVCVAGACSSNTDVVGGGTATTTTTGQGGSGNHGNTGGSGNHGNTGGVGGGGGSCVGSGPCEQACCKITDECGFPVTCESLGNLFDCVNNQPAADCNGTCILNSDCATIMTLAGSTPDPDLYGCLQDCNQGTGGGNPCSTCVTNGCQAQITACAQNPDCQPFLQCAMGCANAPCLEACHTANPSTETDAIASCICGTCSGQCPCGAGGGGGAGGN